MMDLEMSLAEFELYHHKKTPCESYLQVHNYGGVLGFRLAMLTPKSMSFLLKSSISCRLQRIPGNILTDPTRSNIDLLEVGTENAE